MAGTAESTPGPAAALVRDNETVEAPEGFGDRMLRGGTELEGYVPLRAPVLPLTPPHACLSWTASSVSTWQNTWCVSCPYSFAGSLGVRSVPEMSYLPRLSPTPMPASHSHKSLGLARVTCTPRCTPRCFSTGSSDGPKCGGAEC
jgi:hypothetical protein